MHEMVISCSSMHDVEWRQTYGGTSPPTAHSGSRGREVINSPLPSVCDKVCSGGCEIDFLRQLPHFLHNLTRTIHGRKKNNRLRRQHGTASSLLTSIVLTWASAVTLTQRSVPQSMFHKCCDWETPLSLWAVSKTTGKTRPGSCAAEGGSGKREREKSGHEDSAKLGVSKAKWRRKCPEEVYAFSLARTHCCPVSRRQTTREKICAGQAPFPETGWVLKRERETRKDRGERESWASREGKPSIGLSACFEEAASRSSHP